MDDQGREYISQCWNELDKNHREDDNDLNRDAVITAMPGDPDFPVHHIKQYLSLLNPKCNALFQHPAWKIKNPNIWYENVPVDKNTLDGFMKAMSKDGDLSQEYTNHCIRHTTVSSLDQVRFQPNDIISVTGHCHVSSLMPYMDRLTLERRHDMSQALHQYGRSNTQSQQNQAREVECSQFRVTNQSARRPAPAALGALPTLEGGGPRLASAGAPAGLVGQSDSRSVSVMASRPTLASGRPQAVEVQCRGVSNGDAVNSGAAMKSGAGVKSGGGMNSGAAQKSRAGVKAGGGVNSSGTVKSDGRKSHCVVTAALGAPISAPPAPKKRQRQSLASLGDPAKNEADPDFESMSQAFRRRERLLQDTILPLTQAEMWRDMQPNVPVNEGGGSCNLLKE